MGDGRVTHCSQRTGTLPPLPPPTAHTQREGRRLQPRPPALFISLTAGTARATPTAFPARTPRHTQEPALRRGRLSPRFSSRALQRGPGRGARQETLGEAGGERVALVPLSRPKRGLVRVPNDWQSKPGLEKRKKGPPGRQPARVRERKARPRGCAPQKHLDDCCWDQDVPTGRPRDVRSRGTQGWRGRGDQSGRYLQHPVRQHLPHVRLDLPLHTLEVGGAGHIALLQAEQALQDPLVPQQPRVRPGPGRVPGALAAQQLHTRAAHGQGGSAGWRARTQGGGPESAGRGTGAGAGTPRWSLSPPPPPRAASLTGAPPLATE